VRAIRWTFDTPRAWLVAAALLFTYGTLYLLVAKALVIDPSASFGRFGTLPNLVTAPLSARSLTDWLSPAFVLYVSDAIVVAPSIPAIATVVVLGVLIGVNGAMAVEAFVRRPPACTTGGSAWWIAAIPPSFLATFSCCAPTLLLLLGGGAAGAVISIIPLAVPTAALLLAGSVLWSARRLERTTVLEPDPTLPGSPAVSANEPPGASRRRAPHLRGRARHPAA
jgi:hypothetical protein